MSMPEGETGDNYRILIENFKSKISNEYVSHKQKPLTWGFSGGSTV